MTQEQLKQAAIDVLGKAFAGKKVEAHVVQAAAAVLLNLPSAPVPAPVTGPMP